MVKKIFALLICFIGLTIFISILNCQGLVNTITLPNGEVVQDLNGEWDVLVEFYGPWISFNSYKGICKITQKGSSFTGVRIIDDKYNPKGTQNFRGELDKSGIKNVQYISNRWDPIDAKGIISEGGNIVIINDGEKIKVTLTRK